MRPTMQRIAKLVTAQMLTTLIAYLETQFAENEERIRASASAV
jgi:hypothetical protein